MNSQKYSEVMISVRKIVRAINLESKRIEKNLGISIPQLLTLKHLNEQSDYKSTMRRLKDFLSLNASTATGIVARLEAKGYIARLPDPNDKRSTPIVLTSKRKERYICRKSHSMKPVFFTLLTLLFMSSCVAVRFPEEIEIKIEMPENASPEQIEAVMGSLRLEMTKDQGRRVKVVVDSIPGS